MSSKSFQQLKNLSKLAQVSCAKPAVSRAIFDVQSLKEFEERVKCSKKPVVVDFHASWCTPCKALAPRLENIVKKQFGNVHLARVDIDELTDLALDYEVTSVPSLLVMHNGKVLNRVVGLQSSEFLRTWLDKVVRKSYE